MTHEFCPGYSAAPFDALVADYPGEDKYPLKDFRVEWGPIFHRGRLDGSAKVLILGQDPATHETISRRILVGEAGQRTQGFLAKIGIESSYVMVNTFLYSVFGQGGGNRHAEDEEIAKYRHKWLDALLIGTDITAVIMLGTLAKTAFSMWAKTQPQVAAALHQAPIKHPTFPESASAHGTTTLPEATKELHDNWNAALQGLTAHVTPDVPANPTPYTGTWQPGDLVRIPERDLPAGSPGWWCDLDAWADRPKGVPAQIKRATITVTVPTAARTWPPLP
jgi:uracil-DNA glycosylase